MILPLKITFVAFGLWLCLGMIPIQGQLFQDDIDRAKTLEPPQYGISIYPFSIIGSNLTLSLEKSAGFHTSVRAIGSIGMAERSNYYDVDDMTSGYFEVQGRYYPIGPSMVGVYFGGFGYYKRMSFTFDGYDQRPVGSTGNNSSIPVRENGTASGLGLGVLVGYQYVLDKYITGDLYFGAAMQSASIEGPAAQYMTSEVDHRLRTDIWDNYARGLKAHIGVSIGFLIY
jgi:hypothetical protein